MRWPKNNSSEVVQNLRFEDLTAMVRRLGQASLATSFGDWTLFTDNDDTSDEVHIALVYAEIRGVLGGEDRYKTRVSSSCRTNKEPHVQNCECRAELHETRDRIRQKGKGTILYLQQGDRLNGGYDKIFQLKAMFGCKDERLDQNNDDRGESVTTVKGCEQGGLHGGVRDVAGSMLKKLRVNRIDHHNYNPRTRAGLEDNGIEFFGVKNLHFSNLGSANPILLHDLKHKQRGLGNNGSKVFRDPGHDG